MKIGYIITVKQKKGKDLFVKYGITLKSPLERCYYMGKGVKKACVFDKQNAEILIKDMTEKHPEDTIELIRSDDKGLKNLNTRW